MGKIIPVQREFRPVLPTVFGNVDYRRFEEDLLRMGGVGDEELSDTIVATSRSRVPWLLVNLVTAFVSASVISLWCA